MHSYDLDTPSLYVDLDVLAGNIRKMQARCQGMKVGLRPHTKTHKIPEIARMQLAAARVGEKLWVNRSQANSYIRAFDCNDPAQPERCS